MGRRLWLRHDSGRSSTVDVVVVTRAQRSSLKNRIIGLKIANFRVENHRYLVANH